MIKNAHTAFDNLITNKIEGKKAQVGVDLHVISARKINGGTISKKGTDLRNYGPNELKPGYSLTLYPGSYSLTFDQGVKVPSNMTAFIRHRSSVLRCGAIITTGVYDPGFEVDNCGAVIVVTEAVTIEHGARLAQIIFIENEAVSEDELYDGQWQKEKDVK